jgi:hypothetical protein
MVGREVNGGGGVHDKNVEPPTMQGCELPNCQVLSTFRETDAQHPRFDDRTAPHRSHLADVGTSCPWMQHLICEQICQVGRPVRRPEGVFTSGRFCFWARR